jgi:hypothetical protein
VFILGVNLIVAQDGEPKRWNAEMELSKLSSIFGIAFVFIFNPIKRASH